METSAGPPETSRPIDLPDTLVTKFYRVRIDPGSGALVSLKLKSSGREMLGGPANVIVAERPKQQEGDPGDHIVNRPERLTLATSSQYRPKIAVSAGPLATTVAMHSEFYGGGQMVRVIRFYEDYPRIDFETELNDIPDRTVVVAEFPLAEDITEVRRGIPYGFSHGAWAKPNPDLHGWTKGIVPAVRWSHYTLAKGGGVALFDRGLPGRELTGRTPILFLLNATDKYYGYANSWLSGKGRHRFEYAVAAQDGAWEKARVPHMAWEFNSPAVVVPDCLRAAGRSFVQTSDNVIVEAIRREGPEIELRMAECLGRTGSGEVTLALPHQQAALTDLAGAHPRPLKVASKYLFPVRPQQIITMRFRTETAVPEVRPLTDWTPLVPEAKRVALHTRLDQKGHPPRGDAPQASAADKPAVQAKPEEIEWWRQARFGMFVHWGPVSLKGTEIGWSRGDQVPTEAYDELYRQFNPTDFNADDWVSIAKSAGMKYLIFTTKHHDGFCEWDTKFTDYNIMNTPFHRDVVKELAAACRRHGLTFGIYHSICDWHHPDYPLGSPGGRTQKPAPNMDRYNAYLKNQLAELIQGYGPLGVLWFDGEWESPWTYERGVDLNNYVRGLQPGILINNRVGKGRAGMAGTTQDAGRQPGDYDTPEQQVGKFQTDRPWESCITICQQWAWKPNDTMKSLKECLRTLIQCAGGDGNLLFNVGPMPDGRIEPRQVERLQEMGRWLDLYGKTVYGTRGGPFKPGPWGASTFQGNTVYLHLFDPSLASLSLPPIPRTIVRSSVLTGGTVGVQQTVEGITLTPSESALQDVSTIVELQLDGPAAGITPVGVPSASLTAHHPARASNVYQNMPEHDPNKAVDDDDAT